MEFGGLFHSSILKWILEDHWLNVHLNGIWRVIALGNLNRLWMVIGLVFKEAFKGLMV